MDNKWKFPKQFELDGLLFSKSENCFYMIKSKYFLNENVLEKTKETHNKFIEFLNSDKPLAASTSEERGFICR